VKAENISYRVVTWMLRLGLVLGLFAAAWFVYAELPYGVTNTAQKNPAGTQLRILLQPGARGVALDIPLELYPIDIVAARHEYFTERRAGKRFEDFLKERMNGRDRLVSRFDPQGQAVLEVPAGEWWIHALVSGEEDLEWRLRVSVGGQKQTVELTPQNAYTRAKSF
jgi:hypothetical protein